MKSNIVLSSESQSKVRRAVFLYFFFVGLSFSSWASRIPEIKIALGLDDAQWGTMLLMIPIGQLIGMSFSGRLISKVGSHKVIMVAAIGYALTLFLIGAASSDALFIAALIMFGFFGNFCNIAMNTQGVIIENYYAKPIMASFHGGWSSAGLLGGLIGLGMTMMEIPTYIHFAMVAVIVVVGSVMQYKWLQNDAVGAVESQDDTQNSGDKEVKFESFLILLGIVGFFGWATEGTMADWNGIYLHEVVGIDDKYTPVGLTAYMITMTCGRFVMDKATAKWGRRVILCFCGVAVFVGMFMAVLLPYLVTTIIGYMIVGFGACGIIPALYSVAGERTKMHTGRALTIVSTISFFGFLVGPPLIGYISQATNLRYSFALIGIFGLFTYIMSARLKVLKEKR